MYVCFILISHLCRRGVKLLRARNALLSVELINPLVHLLDDAVENGLHFGAGLAVLGVVVVAVSSLGNNPDGSLFGALQGTARTALPRNGGRSPGVVFAIDPEQTAGVDVVPAASLAVQCFLCLSALDAVGETVGIRELCVTNIMNGVFRRVSLGNETGVRAGTPVLPPTKSKSS